METLFIAGGLIAAAFAGLVKLGANKLIKSDEEL
jgi:hypothetical protein